MNTHSLEDVSIGGWYRFLHGGYGTFMTGVELSYARRQLYDGKGGAPNTNEGIAKLSVRYLPWQ